MPRWSKFLQITNNASIVIINMKNNIRDLPVLLAHLHKLILLIIFSRVANKLAVSAQRTSRFLNETWNKLGDGPSPSGINHQ